MNKTKKGQTAETALTRRGSVEELQALVRQHRVCWEVLPEQFPVEGQRPLHVGFNLFLYGAHAPDDHPVPGCEKCKRIYLDLRRITKWILPAEERQSRYEILFYDQAIGYSPVRGNRPDVTVTIKILHRSRYDMPIDECEVLCLNEMKGKLSDLGAQEKRWRERS